MKKFILCAIAALALSTTTHAQTDKESIKIFGAGFYSYEHSENYGLNFSKYTFNGIGFGVNLRSTFKFEHERPTSANADLLLNYSICAYQQNSMKVLFIPEAGPSIGYRIDGENHKILADGFVGIKATLVYKKVAISAGYHMWAPKWKFGKEKADGFYAQLGFDF